ncbi:MAG TPA: hypothetical protein VN771_03820 [Candidatus Baltobacteraceae bacterium]|nr:hypothetical protein [Candidatus Baltobacteraceae bacterium]
MPAETQPADAQGPDDGAAALARLAVVRRRLAAHAAGGAHAGLTGADPQTGERWEAGQVWAHLAEFPAYWLDQFQRLLAARAGGAQEPIPFGRTAADTTRIDAIERDRHDDPRALHGRVDRGIADAEAFIRGLPADAWEAAGLHPRLGAMRLPAMVDRFWVAHLEEHADQLDELLSGRA